MVKSTTNTTDLGGDVIVNSLVSSTSISSETVIAKTISSPGSFDLTLAPSTSAVKVTGNIIPTANNTYVVGNSSFRWSSTNAYYSLTRQNNWFSQLTTGLGQTVTVTDTDTQIKLFPVPGGDYDGGSNKLKFPVAGFYIISLIVEFDEDVLYSYFDIKLKENGGAASTHMRATAGAGLNVAIQDRPFLFNMLWAGSPGQRVGLFGNRPAGLFPDVTDVYVTAGSVSLIEAFN